jgi:DNA-binding IclR family transcriptional regulator
MRLLEIVGKAEGGLTNAEISRALDLATSSCSYVLGELERAGYITRDSETRRYQLGLKLVTLAEGALREIGYRRIAEPALHRLVAETGLTANICVLEGNNVVLVDRVESPAFIRPEVAIGTAFPVNGSAIGKVLLAHLPRSRVLELVDRYGLPRSARKTITSKTRLLAELDIVREQGYAINDEEIADGLRSVGAPIVHPDGAVRAGVSAIGESNGPIWKEMDRVIELVRATGREISRAARLTPWT